METIITAPKEINPQSSKKQESMDIAVHAAVISHKGCVRGNNEDNFFFDGDLMPDDMVNDGAVVRATLEKRFHLFAVCDGMGGLKGGERASSIGVHALSRLNMYLSPNSLERAIDIYANEACKLVYEDSILMGEAGREGSTLALLYLAGDTAHIANVGDSRVYLLRMGSMYQLSTDHSMVYTMMLRGELTREQMRKHPQGNVIMAFLGMEEARKPKPFVMHYSCPLCKGDRFLVCSDGLSDLLSHEEIQAKLKEYADPYMAANQLVWRALEMGGKDNTTCIVVDVTGGKLPEPGPAFLNRLQREKKL